MKKSMNSIKKLDLESINCVESINDKQAESLSAGVFTASTRNGEIDEVGFGRPGEASLDIPIDRSTRSIGLRNRGSGRRGNVFRVTFVDDDSGLFLASRTIRSGRRIGRGQIRNFVSTGADSVLIEQLNRR